MIAIIGQLGLVQLRLFLLDNGAGDAFHILNRFEHAGLDQFVLYPLLMSLIVSAAIYAFNLSFPRLRPKRSWGAYGGIVALGFVFFFVTSFFSSKSIYAGLTGLIRNFDVLIMHPVCLLYTSPSPRDA